MSDYDWKPEIYAYLDFREYLQAYYDAAKANIPAFSYRYFSRKAGFKSPNFLKLVIDGQRSLGPESVDRFAKALKLTEEEHDFFRALVAFEQARTPDEKNEAFERVAASQRFRQARRLDRGMFTYLSRWYYPAIREMAARPDFRDDPAWIASELLPTISPEQAAEALELLFELELLERGDDGRISRGAPSLTTGHEVRSLAIANYHRQMLERAAGSIELAASTQRDLSALTVCIADPTVADVKQRIHTFREQVLNRCDEDSDASAVYQLCIQFFPLTRLEEAADQEA